MGSLEAERHRMGVNDVKRRDGGSQAGVRTGVEAKQKILEGDVDILCRKRLAIVPENFSPDAKRHAQTIATGLPSLCEIG